MFEQLNTKSLFRAHFIAWRILGMSPPQKCRQLYWTFSFLLNVIFILGYPLHLLLGLFRSTTMFQVMQNLSINITCVVCVVKSYAIWWRFHKVHDMFDIIRRQDERQRSSQDLQYLKDVVYPPVRSIIKLFYFLCTCASITSELRVLVNGLLGNWRLMYEGYFPFDPFGSKVIYFMVHIYQFIGVNYTFLQNLVNDTFAPTHLAFLGGQVRMLGRRVAKIGHDAKRTQAQNNQELLDCIREHMDLLEYHDKLEEVVSLYMFFQILLASINMCMVLVFMVLFAQDPFTLAYCVTLVVGMLFEILPSCYYGTILEEEFHNLSDALFSCNWMDQSMEFKKNLRIFAEKSSRRIYVMAWLFRINNNTFIVAYKNTYTLFAVIMNMK